MKSIILLTLFMGIGCVSKTDEQTTPAVEYQRFDPLMVSAEDLSRLKVICDALDVKEERLPALVSSNYTFGYAEKKCEATALGPEVDEVVTIQRPEQNYIFRKKNGESFAFPDVETSIVGSMAVICANIHDLRSPLQTSNKGAIWFTTITSTRHCTSDFDSMCVHIQKGQYVTDVNYSIHTNEWIKFKVSSERTGFFVERKLISTADCSPGKNIEKRVRLK